MSLPRTALRFCLTPRHILTQPASYTITTRNFTTPSATVSKTVRITDNISFRLAQRSHLPQDRRPIVVIYGWLSSKMSHLKKYGDFYANKGFDVLYVRVSNAQMIWPSTLPGVVSPLTDFITEESRRAQPILFHGFSGGGCVHGQTLIKFSSDPKLFASMKDRVKGQIFDSLVEVEGTPIGVAKAVTNVVFLQNTIKFILQTYMRVFPRAVTQYYRDSSDNFRLNRLHTPNLMLYSKKDVVGPWEVTEDMMSAVGKCGALVLSKRWDDSPHVEHFRYHPVEYMEMLNKFLTAIKLQPEVTTDSDKVEDNGDQDEREDSKIAMRN